MNSDESPSKIEALHDFSIAENANKWAEKFKLWGERVDLFNDIANILSQDMSESFKVLELGSGPGYLAEFLLNKWPQIAYHGLDNSEPMIQIATKRNEKFNYNPVKLDLVAEGLSSLAGHKFDAVVTTWALHDLIEPAFIKKVYEEVYDLDAPIFLNGDFIKPVGATTPYETGRFEIQKHLEMLKASGFVRVSCEGKYEENITNPTTANNYALMVGFK